MKRAGYRDLLRTPGAAAFFAPTILGRVGIAMTSLSIVWLIRAATGSYATAGLVTGAFAVADALAGPQIGRLMDRFGQGRVLLPAALAHGVAVTALVLSAVNDAPGWLLATGGAFVGATLPQLSAATLARWSALLDGDRRPAAYALETLSNSVAYLIGPALVSTIAAAGRPVLGSLTAAALVVAGAFLLGLQRRTAPPVAVRDGGHTLHRRALLRPGFMVLVGVNATIGGFFGALSIAVTAFVVERGTPGVAAALFAASNGTGIAAVLVYGLRRPRMAPRLQLAATAAGLGLGSVPLLAGGSAAWAMAGVTAGVLLTAVAVPVVLTLGAVLAAAVVDRRVLTEAFAWLGSASAAGSAVAATAAGLAVDGTGARGGLLVTVAAATATALLAATGIRALRAGSDPETPVDPPPI